MAESQNNPQKSKKHKVIHWNPELDDANQNKPAGITAYLGGAIGALIVVLFCVGAYFLFFYEEPVQPIAQQTAEQAAADNTRRAFESVSRAQGIKDITTRKLDAARQMPTTGNEVLTRMLINIEKEMADADDFMRRSSYAKAIDQYRRVDALIEEFTTEVENKQTARQLYDNFLVRSGELEIGKQLNEEAFSSAFDNASEGKAFLDTGSFTAALQRLQQATDDLDAVENSINEFIRSNAALGHRFISQGKSEEATEAFMRVLEVDPENEEALKQLERARISDRVYAALQAANASEEEGRLEEALASFEKAFSIDKGSAKAQSGVSRVKRKIAERDFTAYYQAAQTAIANARYEEAIDNYQAALGIFPNRSDIENAIEKARSEKRQNDIVTRITRAYNYEREYQWENARDLYQELVNMEPDLQEAKDGLLRTGRMIRSILRYKRLIEVAKTEAQRSEFQQAIRTFDEAMKSKPTYLALTEEGERLRNFLQLQSQPVPVQFISDGSTWVSVQGPTMRKPEKFDDMQISLLPGKYFVIGRKKGHQDVRFGLQIRGGVPQEPLTVICDTKTNF
ncbi:hypothetical protein [Pelagicoccus sp. SDUM812003]|uniref:tetratricopeptide repeat protein n=1 Tax=Pelagicoccus sp. SDUM812003 TaxID=3041267 RepID=UPI00280F8DD4|nr:hypothetical protein [Pelagicoccus sp. SDUM812003]MDQ8205157.1 hypothetical protein [Pelagicoccus sp. SDUM812003]